MIRIGDGESDQCDELPSSLLLVANRIDATNTAMITGTTTNGEVMFIVQMDTARVRVDELSVR